MATGKRSYIVEVISKITGAKATKNDLLGIGDAAKQVEGPIKGFTGSLKILSGIAATLGIARVGRELHDRREIAPPRWIPEALRFEDTLAGDPA